MVLGRLKEQDALITLIRTLILEPQDDLVTMTVVEAVGMVQTMIEEHVACPTASRLRKYAPSVATLFLPLDLTRALYEYDARTKITMRRHVPPTFKEIRHVMNIATIHAVTPHLKMVTFDADDTIYEDGGIVSRGSPMVDIIVRLLRAGIVVSLVTAAGYPGNPGRYETRLRGLLDAFQLFKDMGAPTEMLNRFLVMGGECNYLHRVKMTNGRIGLEAVDPSLWKDGRGVRWSEADIKVLLDTAEATLRKTASALGLDISIIRKERAVGMIRNQDRRFSYEVLEEIALAVQDALKHLGVPHCAFNGGNDVWVDVGNKALGIRALQSFMGGKPHQTLHVGDRFTRTGNDTRAREAANSVWVSDPRETNFVMRLLLRDLHKHLRRSATPTSAARNVVLAHSPGPSSPALPASAKGSLLFAAGAPMPPTTKAAASTAAPKLPPHPTFTEQPAPGVAAPVATGGVGAGAGAGAAANVVVDDSMRPVGMVRTVSFESLTDGDDEDLANLESAFSAMADDGGN